MSRLRPITLVPLALLGAAACAPDAPTAVRAPAASPTRAAAADRAPAMATTAAATDARAIFLAPIAAAQPAFAGAFDSTVASRLTLRICALAASGDACDGTPVRQYTATAGGPTATERVRLVAAREMYVVNWNTAAAPALDPARHYRAQVLLDGTAIGRVDVDLVTSTAGLAGVDTTRRAGAVLGSWVPLGFRVERPLPTEERVVASAELVRAAARRFDAAMVAGTAREAAITELLGALIPIVTPAEAGQLETMRQLGIPLLLSEQIPTLARAFADGGLTTVDAFVAAAGDAGVTQQNGAPLTRAALTAALAPARDLAQHDVESILPAVVSALGHARADRLGLAQRDAVWGDARLDPVQTTLLLYAAHFSGAASELPAPSASVRAPAASVRAADVERAGGPRANVVQVWDKLPPFVRNKIATTPRQLIVGQIGRSIEMPLTPTQAVGRSICASILMYGHRFVLTQSAKDLDRRHVRAKRPGQSDVTAQLVFDFTPNSAARTWFGLPFMGCTLPANGPVPGRQVKWTLNDPLSSHGALTVAEPTTDAGGRARAQYLTLSETVPPAFHTEQLQRSATGTLDVRAAGIVPGWKNLERSVGVGVYNPTDDGVRLTVFHYVMPTVEFSVESRIKHGFLFGGSYYGTVRTMIPLEMQTVPGRGTPVFVGAAPASRVVTYNPMNVPCPIRLSEMLPMYDARAAVGFNDDLTEIDAYYNAPFWREVWSHPLPVPGCSYRHEEVGSYHSSGYAVFHNDEMGSYVPFGLGGLPYLYRIQGWTTAAPGVLRRTYFRAFPSAMMEEQTTLEIRFVTP